MKPRKDRYVKKVGFFIAGAPKCGTTSLASYLEKHPNIHMAKNKEPFFFCEDFPKVNAVGPLGDNDCLETYNRINFSDFPDPQKLYGEGSTFYLYSKVAMARIKQYNTDAKIIVMFRNPADVIFSLIEFRKYGGQEIITDAADIWQLNAARKQGKKLPPAGAWRKDQALLFYDEIASYGSQLKRAYEYFDKTAVKVIFFEDLVASPSDIYAETLEFLGLEHDGRTEFPKENTGKHNRFNKLRQILRGRFYNQVRAAKRLVNIQSLEPLLIKTGLVREGKAASLPDDLRKEIQDHYKGEVKLLEELTGRDLHAWY